MCLKSAGPRSPLKTVNSPDWMGRILTYLFDSGGKGHPGNPSPQRKAASKIDKQSLKRAKRASGWIGCLQSYVEVDVPSQLDTMFLQAFKL